MSKRSHVKTGRAWWLRGAGLSLIILGISLTGCVQYAGVSKTQPRFSLARGAGKSDSPTSQLILRAERFEKRQPQQALADYLVAAKASLQALEANPKDPVALETYNFAVARILSVLQENREAPWKSPVHVPTSDGNFTISIRPDPRPAWNPSLYDFVPTDQFDVRGKYVTERSIKRGVGAPVVAIGKEKNVNSRENFALPRTYYGVTAVLRFRGRSAELALEDPLATESVVLNRREFPLAADFTVPLAVMLASTNPKKMELSRLLFPEKYAETARMSRLQPYDPAKTLVIVIHGLMDTPATWTPLINTLRMDETIRKNYQFWFYSYPSGNAYPYSAVHLRKELKAVQKRFKLQKDFVLIGHSMGGCISRLMITDPGDKLWREIFKKSPEETRMPDKAKRFFSDVLLFQSEPGVGRVLFLAAPLQGSDMASNWAGRIGSSLVRSPRELLQAGRHALSGLTFQPGELRIRRIPNSIDTLAPNNRFVKAINKIPMKPDVPVHVICGDRGKGGNKDKTPPVMSDGIVPYWSSHIPTAKSELIVPSNHAVHQNPQAIAEVARILKASVNQSAR